MATEFGEGMQKVMEQIQKLLNLAAKNSNEHEAASAAAKAQELLTRYNLDAALVERAGGAASGKREDFKTRGGFYQYQRNLWNAVAHLNFCLYWTQQYWEKHEQGFTDRNGIRRYEKQSKRHRIIGRVVNTQATIAMAQYLEGTVERLTRERLEQRGEDSRQFFSRWAMSYREGIVERVVEKLGERYRQRVDEDRKRAQQAGMAGASASTALTLVAYKDAEKDANMDFLYGEGYSARQRERKAEYAREAAETQAAYARWALEHPEEARAKEKAAEEESEKYWRRHRSRGGSTDRKERDWGAFRAGYEKGKDVSIDQQMKSSSPVAGKIGR